MSLNLNQEIWMYVERLYMHCYNSESFKLFLQKYGIEYDNSFYAEFNKTEPLYKFMSVPDFSFAHFMQTIPTYKYLKLLEKIVFDETIIATRKDGWNYYGTYIKEWHPRVVELLRATGVLLDPDLKKLLHSEEEKQFEGPDFLPYDFNDLFLDYIRKEINESYTNGQLLAVIVLSRKLLEALIIRIMEVMFPKLVSGVYKEQNHELWYDKERNIYKGFEKLLSNLASRASEFHEDKDLIESICADAKRIKNEANVFVHRDYKIPDEVYIKSVKIEAATVAVRKLYKKYCNP